MKIQYRICRFIPSLFEPNHSIPFAIIAASESHLVLAGIDIDSCGRRDPHPVGADIIAHTFDTVWSKAEAIIRGRKPANGYEIIALMTSPSPTNIQFDSITEEMIESDNALDATRSLFEKKIVQDPACAPCGAMISESEKPRWRQSPKMQEQELCA